MDQFRPELIPNPAVRRLSLYLRQLEAFKRRDRTTVSSKQLGESLGLTDAQVIVDDARVVTLTAHKLYAEQRTGCAVHVEAA